MACRLAPWAHRLVVCCYCWYPAEPNNGRPICNVPAYSALQQQLLVGVAAMLSAGRLKTCWCSGGPAACRTPSYGGLCKSLLAGMVWLSSRKLLRHASQYGGWGVLQRAPGVVGRARSFNLVVVVVDFDAVLAARLGLKVCHCKAGELAGMRQAGSIQER